MSLCLLESYHVLLLQRPALLSAVNTCLTTDLADVPSARRLSPAGELGDFSDMLISIINPHTAFPTSSSSWGITLCLTAIVAISSRAGHCQSLTQRPTTLWRVEHLELCLHRWLNSSRARSPISLSDILVFHMCFINMRTDIELVHRVAHLKAYSSDISDSHHTRQLRDWQRSEHSSVAVVHAKQLVDAAKEYVIFNLDARSGHSTPIPSSHSRQNFEHKPTEGPHLATSVYIATLTLWASIVVQEDADLDQARGFLESGIHVLSCLNVRVATKLGNVLKHLSRKCNG